MLDTIVVYIDILLFVNTVINGMIIYITSRLLGIKSSPARFAGATAIASFYGLMVCFPAFSFTLNIIFKGLAALLICLTAFKFKTIKGYFKNVFIFLFVSYTYIGLITSCQYLPFFSDVLYIKNGEVYFNFPLPYILIMTLVLCFIQTIVTKFFIRQRPKESIYTCEIALSEKTALVHCFLDTGNFLREAISGLPVAVIEINALKDILPEALYKNKDNDILDFITSTDDILHTRFRIIPFKSAGVLRACCLLSVRTALR